MLTPERHDLLFLSDEGMHIAGLYCSNSQLEYSALLEQFPFLPAICKTQSGLANKGWIEIGYSFPIRSGNMRKRISSQVPQSEIIKKYTPWQAIQFATDREWRVRDFLLSIQSDPKCENIHMGLFGSAALEAVTGLPYLHSRSDIDLVLRPAPEDVLRAFEYRLSVVEQTFGIRADAELMFSAGKYVKLKELLGKQSTALVKGSHNPHLMLCQEIWKVMSLDLHNK